MQRLRTLSRRRRLVQATSVRVDAASGPATLSFFIDQTEASRAQEALRRSEAMRRRRSSLRVTPKKSM